MLKGLRERRQLLSAVVPDNSKYSRARGFLLGVSGITEMARRGCPEAARLLEAYQVESITRKLLK